MLRIVLSWTTRDPPHLDPKEKALMEWYRDIACMLGAFVCGCSHDPAPPPPRAVETSRPAAAVLDDEPPRQDHNAMAHRAKLSHGAELYLPPWFEAHRGGYDVVIHFHGLPRLQEANVETAHLNAAMVSINRGVGTAAYASVFPDEATFAAFLDEIDAEVTKTHRAPGSKRRKLALTAWSAGFVAVGRAMADASIGKKVDAVLLADGFYTSFSNVKKRTMNLAALEKWTSFAEAAKQGSKLFALTHTAIPTGEYPSVQEVAAKLVELVHLEKTHALSLGPRKMKETYFVDAGSFHVHGYDGLLAGDHIRQIQVMGETLYPYLKERWETVDGATVTANRAGATTTP